MNYQKSSPETIQAMFAAIAPNYDRGNTLSSLGLHKLWNRKLIEAMKGTDYLLDLCAGTGEIAFGFLKHYPNSKAILIDFCSEMLAIAEKKGGALQGRFAILQGDAQKIPLCDGSVNGVTIAYGIRNVKEPICCLNEVFRVLSPGGKLGILELTRPISPIAKLGHKIYTHLVLPILGKISAKNPAAYRYLANSVNAFDSPETIFLHLKKIGFKNIEVQPLTLGTATLFTAIKEQKMRVSG